MDDIRNAVPINHELDHAAHAEASEWVRLILLAQKKGAEWPPLNFPCVQPKARQRFDRKGY